jgi:phosphomannomutase
MVSVTSNQTKTFDLSASFKAYDVRGIVGESITAEIVEAVGAAFVDVLDLAGQTVLVGGDMRPSSPEFSRAFANGAATRGANVQLLDLISTDELYYACGALNAAGATFTASHNPAEYNGIKMAKAGAVPISSETGLKEIQAQAEDYLNAGTIPAHGTRGLISVRDVLKDYSKYLRSLVDLSRSRPLKVVVDAGNGMAGMTTPAVLGDTLLAKLPLEIIPLYFELDGSFPNHPANPLEPENLRDLQAAVVEHGADIGLAFDGDADRCFVIDEKGEPVSPSAVTGMVARREIARAIANGEDNPTIIHNLLTSRAVPELVARDGGRAVRTRVGSELGREYEPYRSSGEINSEIEDKAGAVERVRADFQEEDVEVDHLDGSTFIAADGSYWFNLRPSNTEPFLRLNVEATDLDIMERVRDRVLALVRG